jgi:streptogramin lyase
MQPMTDPAGGGRLLIVALATLTVVIAMAGPSPVAAQEEPEAPQALNPELFTNLGTAVSRNSIYNHALGYDADGNPLYFQAYKGEPWILLVIDPLTGETVQHTSEHGGNPYGIQFASNGKLYISTGGSGQDRVYCYDPAVGELEYLGRPTETEDVVWTLAEGDDGTIWGGTYPNSKLISIDPATNEMRDWGRISPTQPYVRFLDAKGPYVYCNCGPSRPEVWAFDTRTGEKTEILPDRLRQYLRYGYVQKRADGEMYIEAGGEKLRLNGLEFEPVDELPPAVPANHQGKPDRQILVMRDGTVITANHQTGQDRRYFIQPPGEERRAVSFEYEGTKTALWALEAAPDGLIYGTTRSPITLFSIDPATDEVTVLGDPIGSNGQVYGWVWHEGKLYMAAYSGGTLTVWDPAKPWQFGGAPESNPRYLGTLDIGRPAALIVAPDGRHLLSGGVPTYGDFGGVITVIEPETQAIEVIPELFGTQSIASMLSVPDSDLVCIGTTWRGGSASEAPKTDPRIMLWDFTTRETTYETVPVPGEDGIVQMVMVDDLVYATTNGTGHLVVFDPHEQRVVHTAELGSGPGCLFGLRHNPADGMLYAISGDSIVRIDPASYEIELLGTYPGLDWGLGTAGDSIYMYAGSDLIKFSIPPVE